MLLYLDDLNGAPRVVWGEELRMLEAEAVHINDDGESSNLRLWLLYDMFQCQNVCAKNVLNTHIRSITFLCKHTNKLLQHHQPMQFLEFNFELQGFLLKNCVAFCHFPVEHYKTQWRLHVTPILQMKKPTVFSWFNYVTLRVLGSLKLCLFSQRYDVASLGDWFQSFDKIHGLIFKSRSVQEEVVQHYHL